MEFQAQVLRAAADKGSGNAVNVAYAVPRSAMAGAAAAVIMEDSFRSLRRPSRGDREPSTGGPAGSETKRQRARLRKQYRVAFALVSGSARRAASSGPARLPVLGGERLGTRTKDGRMASAQVAGERRRRRGRSR